MHNWYTVEVEAELRRQEWEREAAADARAARALAAEQGPARQARRGLSLARLSPANLRALTAGLAPRQTPRPAEG